MATRDTISEHQQQAECAGEYRQTAHQPVGLDAQRRCAGARVLQRFADLPDGTGLAGGCHQTDTAALYQHRSRVHERLIIAARLKRSCVSVSYTHLTLPTI